MKELSTKLLIFLVIIFSLSCKKESLDDLILSDGMIVFTLDGKDWIVRDMVASYSDFTSTGGGEVINILGSVQVDIDIYKSISVSFKDIESISQMNYPFTADTGNGTRIDISEAKTTNSGLLYNSVNPEDNTTSNGNLKISVFNRTGNTITGSFSGEIFKTSYTDNTLDSWIKTTIKSGRFKNIPVIIGK